MNQVKQHLSYHGILEILTRPVQYSKMNAYCFRNLRAREFEQIVAKRRNYVFRDFILYICYHAITFSI